MARDPELIRINRLRRMARRQNLWISKSRRRDPLAVDFGRWMVLDQRDRPVFGTDYSATLDEIEAYLSRKRT